MKRSALIVAALALPLIAGNPAAGQGTAPSPAAPADAVVATVNGQEITGADVQDFFETLPPQYRQMPMEQIYPQLVERLIDQRLLAGAARSSGVADTPEFKKQMKMLTDGLLQEAYLKEQIGPQLSEERLREEYRRRTALEPKREEVRARHILLKTREVAVTVIAELKGGADFAKVAEEKSTGPSSRNGGDLGFFAREQMVPPFSEAAFALKAGEMTDEPVQTQFGWHVIKVEERRMAGSRPFEEMEEQLRQEISEKAYTETLQGLRSKAKITMPGSSGIQRVQ
ncbi:MAG: peptidylprolyl isomerase [Alphaproteobacteria bacterium]|nr:peptidylprolyl isomerase [Alphaproteobacteria bacterium]